MSRARDLADGTFSGAFEADSPTLVVDAANNRVGVGTTTPDRLVHLKTSVNNTAVLRIESTATDSYPFLSLKNDAREYQLTAHGPLGDVFSIYDGTAGSHRFVITSTGSVGIGTATPASSIGTGLHIATASGDALVLEKPTGASLQFRSDNTTVRSTIAGINGADGLTFLTGAAQTERARITSAGQLVLGATTQYSDGTIGTPRLQWNGVAGSHSGAIAISNTTGNLGLLIFRNPNGLVGSIETSGTSTSYVTTSDYRLKENVVPLAGAADRLMQIPVCRFNFIADPDKTVDGFLAHEVQAFVPEAITGTKDEVDDEGNPKYQGIDQSKLVPLLTAALQEALADIATLKAEVAALKGSA